MNSKDHMTFGLVTILYSDRLLSYQPARQDRVVKLTVYTSFYVYSFLTE